MLEDENQGGLIGKSLQGIERSSSGKQSDAGWRYEVDEQKRMDPDCNLAFPISNDSNRFGESGR